MNQSDKTTDAPGKLAVKEGLNIGWSYDGAEVFPSSPEDIQEVLRYANRTGSHVCWKTCEKKPEGEYNGNGDCIVVNVSGMKKILEVNEGARYAVVEPGVSNGELDLYIRQKHPGLRHAYSMARSGESVVSCALKDAPNDLSTLYGTTSDMVNGMEVVLPYGACACIGSCSIVPSWFNIGPLPDLRGLFLNWDGLSGIVTKLSVRLFDAPLHSDLVMYTLKDAGALSDVIGKIVHTEVADQVNVISREFPSYMKGIIAAVVRLSGVSSDELEFKRDMLKSLFAGSRRIFYKDILPPELKQSLIGGAPAADCGMRGLLFVLPLGKISPAIERIKEIIHRHGCQLCLDFSVTDHGHKLLAEVGYKIPENGGEYGPSGYKAESGGKAAKELEDALNGLGGVIWGRGRRTGADWEKRIHCGAGRLEAQIQNVLDPNGIMRPAYF